MALKSKHLLNLESAACSIAPLRANKGSAGAASPCFSGTSAAKNVAWQPPPLLRYSYVFNGKRERVQVAY
jgi:hypothetical protein